MSLADQISERGLWNPYDFANPVNDRQIFAGRGDAMRDISYYLNHALKAPRPINLVLAGRRSAGKTSLLNRIAHEAGAQDFLVARVDLNEGDIAPNAFFYKVYDAIFFAAVESGAFGGLEGGPYSLYRARMDGGSGETVSSAIEGLLFPNNYSACVGSGRPLSEPTLRRDLSIISRQVKVPCVVLFDECDVLSKSRVELQMLRNVFMNTAGYMLVFAGTPDLFPLMEEVFSPIIRQFKKVPVESFSQQVETQECVENPLKAIGLDPQDVLKPAPWDLSYEIHELSGGRPYEIQLLCHYMFKRVEDGDSRDMEITLDVLDDVRRELEKQDAGEDRRLREAVSQFSERDFMELQVLTEFEGNSQQIRARQELFGRELEGFEVDEAVDRFVRLGLLSRSEEGDGVIRFAGDQFDEVYARYVAASLNQRFFVWRGDFQSEIDEALRNYLVGLDFEAALLYLPGGTRLEVRRRLSEVIEALTANPAPSSLPDATGAVHSALLPMLHLGRATIARVGISLLGYEADSYLMLPTEDEGNFQRSGDLRALETLCKDRGFGFKVEMWDVATPSREDMLERMLLLASPNQHEEFSMNHYSYAMSLYRQGDFSSAVDEFAESARLNPDALFTTAAAHCCLAVGRWSDAVDFASQSRMLANLERSDGLTQYTFASYDLAVASIQQGREAVAKLLCDEIESCVKAQSHAMIGIFFVFDSAGDLQAREGDFDSAFESLRNHLGI